MERRLFVLLSTVALIASCGQPDALEETVKIYKPLGSVQCGGGNIIPPETMARELLDANIPVRATACGLDGLIHLAMCGEPDGNINIFTIPSTKEAKALALGFKRMSDLPNARENPCQ